MIALQDREVLAAKEKLAECQRTILILEKQLSSLGQNTKPTRIDEHAAAQEEAINKVTANTAHQYMANNNKKKISNSHIINNHQWLHHQSQAMADPPQYNVMNPHLLLHQTPLRTHSDHIGYRGMITDDGNNKNANQYSVADYLLMEEDHRPINHPASPAMAADHHLRNGNVMRCNSTVDAHITHQTSINLVPLPSHAHAHDRRGSSSQHRIINPNSSMNNPSNLQRSSLANCQAAECKPSFGSRLFSRSNPKK
jgi:hypothetical protein